MCSDPSTSLKGDCRWDSVSVPLRIWFRSAGSCRLRALINQLLICIKKLKKTISKLTMPNCQSSVTKSHLTNWKSCPRHKHLLILFTGIRVIKMLMEPSPQNIRNRLRQIPPSPLRLRINGVSHDSEIPLPVPHHLRRHLFIRVRDSRVPVRRLRMHDGLCKVLSRISGHGCCRRRGLAVFLRDERVGAWGSLGISVAGWIHWSAGYRVQVADWG